MRLMKWKALLSAPGGGLPEEVEISRRISLAIERERGPAAGPGPSVIR